MTIKSAFGIFSAMILISCSDKSEPTASVSPKVGAESLKKSDKDDKSTDGKVSTDNKGEANKDLKMEPVDGKSAKDAKKSKIKEPKFTDHTQGKWTDQGKSCLPAAFDMDSESYVLNSQMISGLDFGSVQSQGSIGQQANLPPKKGGKEHKGNSVGQQVIVVQGNFAQVFEQTDGVQNQIGQGEIEVDHETINDQTKQGNAKIKFPMQEQVEESYFDQNDMYLTAQTQDCTSGRLVQKFAK